MSKPKNKRSKEHVAFAKELLKAMVSRPNTPAIDELYDVHAYIVKGAIKYADTFFKALEEK